MRAGNLAVLCMGACLIAVGRWDLFLMCMAVDFVAFAFLNQR